MRSEKDLPEDLTLLRGRLNADHDDGREWSGEGEMIGV
jgi:hypothetical protein